MLVGDAAHHSDPLSGGIANAMHAGKFAAEAAVDGIHNNDVSENALGAYPKRWDSEIGKHLNLICRIRDGISKFSDEMLDSYAETLSKVPGDQMTLLKILQTMLIRQPRLFLELRHLILAGWV